MKLSNRTWRAVAHRLAESVEPAHATLWGKVEVHAKGKRHALTTIPLTPDEHLAVLHVLNHADDEYMRFVIEHERKINPEMVA